MIRNDVVVVDPPERKFMEQEAELCQKSNCDSVVVPHVRRSWEHLLGRTKHSIVCRAMRKTRVRLVAVDNSLSSRSRHPNRLPFTRPQNLCAPSWLCMDRGQARFPYWTRGALHVLPLHRISHRRTNCGREKGFSGRINHSKCINFSLSLLAQNYLWETIKARVDVELINYQCCATWYRKKPKLGSAGATRINFESL